MSNYISDNKGIKKKAQARYRAYKKNKKSKIKIFFILLVIILFASAGGWYYYTSLETEEIQQVEKQEGELTIEKSESSNQNTSNIESAAESQDDELETSVDEIDAQVEEYLSNMNLESRVGQLFMTSPEELTGVGIVVQAGETSKQMIKKYCVGGLLFGSQNFELIDQMKLMLTSIDVYTSVPIFLAMDEEGAVRITNTNNTLLDVGFNLEYVEEVLYFLSMDESEKISTSISGSINVVIIENQNIVDVINEGAELLIVEDNFTDLYDEVLSAVRNGEIEESVLEERVRAILTYKVENNL